MITNEYTNAQYHALDSISKSGLDLIAKSPAHFKAGWQGIAGETARVGTSVHAAVLENGAGLIVAPDTPRASGADRATWQNWFQDHGAEIDTGRGALPAAEWFGAFEKQTGMTIVKQAELDTLRQIRESVMSVADGLLDEGEAEQSILFDHSGVKCRIRPDWINKGRNTIVDIKSCRDASEHGFAQSVSSYRYQVQDAFYSAGYYDEFDQWPTFVFIAVEKVAPYAAALYVLDAEAQDNGVMLMERDLETYRTCLETDAWPGYRGNRALPIRIYDRVDVDVVEDYDTLMA